MTETLYHRVLRIVALTLALVLLFDSGLLSPVTKELSSNAQHYLAQSIGMYAAVQPTELNQYTADLREREHALDEREAALNKRELNVGLNTDGSQVDSTFVLSVLVFLLLVLIVLNYVLDFLRANPVPRVPRPTRIQHE